MKWQTKFGRMLAMSDAAAQPGKAPINALVPMIRVANGERSAKFYRLRGFEIGNYVPREAPPMNWAWLYQPERRIGKPAPT